MIEFFSETKFELENSKQVSTWIKDVILKEKFVLGEITYIFCDDEYLHKINLQFLNHDTFTDIISFDNTLGNEVHGEIYISVERVKDNALQYEVTFEEELNRVMIHGVLHFCGYTDKSEEESLVMRLKEDECLLLLKD
ncbi:MAG: rRNA maturation RNase YbeY [Bacteroidetes bacterium]|nr:rRNA maturation RNase YbeY [Bacteroidota bacterium]